MDRTNYKKPPVKMSSRLHTVAGMITPGKIVADIGTDHGYIPIYQVMTGASPYAYACDIAKGPLKRAEDNVKLYCVQDKVELVLSDGLKGLRKMKGCLPESIVIAGMGGCLVCRILKDCPEVAKGADELILSPHSEWYEVRSFLASNSYSICDEAMIKDEGKFYVIIKAVYGDSNNHGSNTPPDELMLQFGPCLLKRKDPVLHEYLTKEINTCNKILDNLKDNGGAGSRGRLEEIRARKEVIEKALKLIGDMEDIHETD